MTNEITDVLPGWAPWVGPGLSVVALALFFLWVPCAVILWSLHRARSASPWTERARWIHVARRASQGSILLLPVFAVAATLVFIGPASAIPSGPMTGLLALLGVFGGLSAVAFVGLQVHGEDIGLPRSLSQVTMVYLPLLALLALGWFAPSTIASWWMIPWSCLAVLVIRGWLRIPLLLLRTPMAAPAGDRLTAVVGRVSAVSGTEVGHVIELRSPQPNAFAFPWLKAIAVTTGLLRLLDDEELEAIIHHELAHLGESAALTRFRQAQLYALLLLALTRPLFGSYGIAGPIGAVLVFLVVTELVRRRSLVAERVSDGVALEAIHHSVALGQALEKTYRAGLIPAVLKRASHGQLHERLAAAGVEPEFEVPSPPPSTPVFVAIVGGAVTFGIVMLTPWLAYRVVEPGSDVPIQMSAVLPIYGSDPLEALALDAELEEQWEDAALLYEAAAQTSTDPYLRSAALRLWAFAGDCDRARDNAALAAPVSSDEAQYYDDLIDWCEVTGGMKPTG